MAITSEDIQNQSFSVNRKGYDVDEVDVFLEHVAAEIDGLNAEIDALNAEIDELHERLSSAPAFDDAEMDMDAAFAEPALPAEEPEPAKSEKPGDSKALAEKDARIAELEKQLKQKQTDSSAIADALVTAQRSAKEVIESAKDKAEHIIAEAEADAADIIDRANTEKANIEKDIDSLDKMHDETCDMYAKSLREFIEDASKKLAGVENAKGTMRANGKKPNHGRFASPSQAPVHKPAAKPMGAVSPSYTAPIAAVPAAPVSAAPAAANPGATAAVSPAAPKPCPVEKDLSGFGDASDGFDFSDVD